MDWFLLTLYLIAVALSGYNGLHLPGILGAPFSVAFLVLIWILVGHFNSAESQKWELQR